MHANENLFVLQSIFFAIVPLDLRAASVYTVVNEN